MHKSDISQQWVDPNALFVWSWILFLKLNFHSWHVLCDKTLYMMHKQPEATVMNGKVTSSYSCSNLKHSEMSYISGRNFVEIFVVSVHLSVFLNLLIGLWQSIWHFLKLQNMCWKKQIRNKIEFPSVTIFHFICTACCMLIKKHRKDPWS